MPNAFPEVDHDVMRRCYDVVNAMFKDRSIHDDTSKRWWRRPNSKFEHAIYGYRSPIDTLLDGEVTDVYREAEAYCEVMAPLTKASQ